MRLKKNEEQAINVKVIKGVTVNAMQNFCVVDGEALSLAFVKKFDCSLHSPDFQGFNALKKFIIEEMIEKRKYTELIFVGWARGTESNYVHSKAFVMRGDALSYCDAQMESAQWH